MSSARECDLSSLASDLDVDQRRAERLLRELATELLRVPVDQHTRALHLRALVLKRIVMGWTDEQPNSSIRDGVVSEVVAMQEEARGWRSSSTEGRGLGLKP